MQRPARVLPRGFGLFVLSLIAAALSLPATSAAFQRPRERKEVEKRQGLPVSPIVLAPQERLRQRVEQFYALMQLGHWEQAEAYVVPDSRENFRKQPKNPFLGFKLESLDVDADGQSATVRLQMEVVSTMSAGVVAVPQTSHWMFIDRQWYLAVPDPANQGKNFQALFSGKEGPAAPAPEELKFKGSRYALGKLQPTEIKVASFPFTNVTNHVVTLTSVETYCPCLQVKSGKKEFKPGESGDLVIEFNPAGFSREYMQTIVVKTDPGDLTTRLMVMAYVIPPEPERPKRRSKSKPAVAPPAVQPGSGPGGK